MQKHFTTHQQKYLTFFVVAVLVFVVSYAARDTEALGNPMDDAMMAQTGRRCPPRFAQLGDMVRFFHPCFREFLHIDSAPARPAQEAPSPTESVSSSTQATSTPETATTTDATSTSETDDAPTGPSSALRIRTDTTVSSDSDSNATAPETQ